MILPSKENTAIIVVTYNPDDRFMHALSMHEKIVNIVIIVDNASNNKSEWINRVRGHVLIENNVNLGIGAALNKGIRIAKKLKMDYILTFDQDSIPVENILELYGIHMNENIALIGTRYAQEVSGKTKISLKQTLTIITSGCLHNLEAVSKVGDYDESLFIDGVDFDFSIRCKEKGYIVTRSKESLISHRLGNPKKKWGIESSNHTILRRYYMSRNHVILTRRYGLKYPIWLLKKQYFFISDIAKLILVEDDKTNKLQAIIRGIKDGILFN